MKLSKSKVSLKYILKSQPLSQNTIDRLERAQEQALRKIKQNKDIYLESNLASQFYILR